MSYDDCVGVAFSSSCALDYKTKVQTCVDELQFVFSSINEAEMQPVVLNIKYCSCKSRSYIHQLDSFQHVKTIDNILVGSSIPYMPHAVLCL